MINLYIKKTGDLIGPLSQHQLDFLIDELEEETLDDQDYYIDGPTLDFLQGKGADKALLSMLEKAVGEAGHTTVQWREV